MLNRKQVNDETESIIRRYYADIRQGSEMESALALGGLLRDLKAHIDAIVEAALKEGAGS